MRIDTTLTDEQRDAVKEYAVQNGYTMPKAYTQLILDALHDRFCMRYHPETENYGVMFAGYNNNVLTYTTLEKIQHNLKYHEGEWVRVYSPRWYALERAGIAPEREPSIWFDGEEEEKELKDVVAEGVEENE